MLWRRSATRADCANLEGHFVCRKPNLAVLHTVLCQNCVFWRTVSRARTFRLSPRRLPFKRCRKYFNAVHCNTLGRRSHHDLAAHPLMDRVAVTGTGRCRPGPSCTSLRLELVGVECVGADGVMPHDVDVVPHDGAPRPTVSSRGENETERMWISCSVASTADAASDLEQVRVPRISANAANCFTGGRPSSSSPRATPHDRDAPRPPDER